MDPQAASDESATNPRRESHGLALGGPAAVQPSEVETQPDRYAHRESCEQLVVERGAGHRRDDDHHAEEPAAQAEHDRVERPQRRASLASEAYSLVRSPSHRQQREDGEERETD